MYTLQSIKDGDFMRQFTVELDEMACKWLEHISELTGKPVESVIASVISNQVIALEDSVFKSFADSECD